MRALGPILALAPFRHMVTPGGYRMSVAMTNCGDTGWVTDRRGYRYDAVDPLTERPWPADACLVPSRRGSVRRPRPDSRASSPTPA